MRETTLHYRCTFEISSDSAPADLWQGVVGRVRDWVSRKAPEIPVVRRPRFVNGGTSVVRRSLVETLADVAEGLPVQAENWALRFERRNRHGTLGLVLETPKGDPTDLLPPSPLVGAGRLRDGR